MYSNNPHFFNWFFLLSTAIFTYRTQLCFASRPGNMDAIEENVSKHFSIEEKKVAIALWKANVPLKTIRVQCNMSERTLRRILGHAKKNPRAPVLTRKKGTGRTPSITSHTLQQMKEGLRKNPCLTAKQLKERIPGLALVNVRWIQRLCKDKLKLPSRKMAKKPLLSQRMKDQRLAFAMEYRDWGVEQWKDVMFSDESHFELHLGDKHGRCRRPVGSDRFDPRFTMKTVKHPAKVMVWGCFSWQGRGGAGVPQEGGDDEQPEVPEGA